MKSICYEEIVQMNYKYNMIIANILIDFNANDDDDECGGEEEERKKERDKKERSAQRTRQRCRRKE